MRGRRLHQHRHHPFENPARGRAASFRLRLPGHLRRQLPREREDHHGGPGLPGPARDQDRNRRHRLAAHAQRRASAGRQRLVCRPAHHPRYQSGWSDGLPGRKHHHRHRHQARGVSQGSLQQSQHHQQRPDPEHAGDPQDLHRGGRRRDRRRVHLHVRHAGRPHDPGGKTAPAAGIRRRRKWWRLCLTTCATTA